jgi:hypothetical protein
MRYITDRLEDVIASLVTAMIGGYIVWEASGYKLGTLTNMGPGYFPIMLGSLMLFLAFVMLLTARPSSVPQPIGMDQLRGILFLAAAFIAFAFTVEAYGMLLSVFLGVFLSALGNRNTRWLHALILAVATAVVATLIFRVGLGLQIEAY